MYITRYFMKIKLLYIVILFCVFTYCLIVGHYQVFPYDILRYNYSLISKTKSKIINYNNFSKNKKCVIDINKEIELIENPDYSFLLLVMLMVHQAAKTLEFIQNFTKNY